MASPVVSPDELLKGVGVLQIKPNLPEDLLADEELVRLLLILDRNPHPAVDRAVVRRLNARLPKPDPVLRPADGSNEDVRRMLIALWSACDGGNRGYVYASVPITSGRRELALMRRQKCSREELRTLHRRARYERVIGPNETDAAEFCEYLQELLRRNPRSPWQVLNPAGISVLDWSQGDYMDLWLEVVELFAVAIALTPGWAYSGGSRQELDLALKLGLPVYDALGRIIPHQKLELEDKRARQTLRREGMNLEEIDAYLPPVQFLRRPYVPRHRRSRQLSRPTPRQRMHLPR